MSPFVAALVGLVAFLIGVAMFAMVAALVFGR